MNTKVLWIYFFNTVSKIKDLLKTKKKCWIYKGGMGFQATSKKLFVNMISSQKIDWEIESSTLYPFVQVWLFVTQKIVLGPEKMAQRGRH